MQPVSLLNSALGVPSFPHGLKDADLRSPACRKASTENPHNRGKEKSLKENDEGDSEVEDDLAERGEVGRGRGKAMKRQGHQTAQYAPGQGQTHRLQKKRSENAPPGKAQGS
jgi:hypothetical protein